MRAEGGARPMSDWGINRADATFMATNGRGMRDTIFFSGNQYYKISEATYKVRNFYILWFTFYWYMYCYSNNF